MRLNIDVPPLLGRLWRSLDACGSTLMVGGAVRDFLLGKVATDYDFATALTPVEIKAALSAETVITRNNPQLLSLTVAVTPVLSAELTTFRAEFGPFKNRKPARVERLDCYELDALRRDFSINALAVTVEGDLIDPVGGLADLKNRRLCVLGDPYLRFEEDPLRVLRLWRFAHHLGFKVEKHTAAAATGRQLWSLQKGPALRYELAYWKDKACPALLPEEVAEFVRSCLGDYV